MFSIGLSLRVRVLDDLMSKVYLLESEELHPIAKRLSSFISEKFSISDEFKLISDKVVVSGSSVEGTFSELSRVKLGSRRGLNLAQLEVPDELGFNLPATEVLVSENDEVKIIFYLQDKLRVNFPKIIRDLKELGLEIYLLSGDKREVVEVISFELGVKSENSFSEMTPEMKQAKVKNLGEHTAMVGDGINDVSAIRAASIGISVTGGLELFQKVGGNAHHRFYRRKVI